MTSEFWQVFLEVELIDIEQKNFTQNVKAQLKRFAEEIVCRTIELVEAESG